MKKVLFFAALLVCGLTFNSCNETAEVVAPSTGDTSLSKTSAALVGSSAQDAQSDLEDAGYTYEGSNEGYEFYSFEDGDDLIVVAYATDNNGTVISAQSIVYSENVSTMLSTLKKWDSYAAGQSYDFFSAHIEADNDENEFEEEYYDGRLFNDELDEYLDALEEAYKDGEIDEEAYKEYKEYYSNAKKHSNFSSDLSKLKKYEEWEVEASFIKFDDNSETTGTYFGFEGEYEYGSDENYIVYFTMYGNLADDESDSDYVARKVAPKKQSKVNIEFIKNLK